MSTGQEEREADSEETVTTVGKRRKRWSSMIGHWVLTLALVGLIAWILLANVSDLEAVGEALAGVSLQAGILLVVLFLMAQLLIAAQFAITVPGIGMPRALTAVEGAAAVSNTVPGPSGTATRLGMLRTWGFYTEDFARSWLFTSSLTNLVVLVMPVIAVLIAAIDGEISTGIVVLALIGLAVSVTGIVLVWLMLRSETFSRRIGTLVGRFTRWARGVVHRRPSERDFADAAVQFRDDLRDTWSASGARVVAAVVGVYVLNGIMLAVSMRAVGLGTDELPIGSVAVVYTIVRLLTIVNFTPGGVGVTEALYVSAFLTVTGGSDESQIVAGVILFRGVTYAGPIILGSIALLIWKLRTSWRVAAPPEPLGSAAVAAVVVDREPPPDPPRRTPAPPADP